jgi:hypothetical protein
VAAALAAAAGCSGNAEPEGRTYAVYYLGGQSNMDGHGYVEELPEDLRGTVERVMIFTGRTGLDDDPSAGVGMWAPLGPGFGTGFSTNGQTNEPSSRFGPELTFGATLADLRPDSRVALIKYSLGGSGLAAGVGFGSWDPDYREGAGRNQYDHALRTIQNALSQADIDGDGTPDRLVPAGIIWMQGEADAEHSQEAADAYETNLGRLMNLLRSALGDEDLPVVIGKVTDSGMADDGSVMDHIETVQQAQARFTETDRCARLVTITDNLAYPSNDAWHYDTEGYLRLGVAFAAAVLELQRNCLPAD